MTEPTRADYTRIFEEECARSYPVIDAFEKVCGHALDTERLEEIARTMACPFKANPPNWQHGRAIYALLRKLLAGGAAGNVLDIGTAKGFSAVVAGWALEDAGVHDRVVRSVDIMQPSDLVRRNSVMELDGYKTIAEYTSRYLAPNVTTRFYGGGSLSLLEELLLEGEQLAFVFVDGKHSTDAVRREINLVRKMQTAGAMVLFDDVQIPAVATAVERVPGYHMQQLAPSGARRYAIATRL